MIMGAPRGPAGIEPRPLLDFAMAALRAGNVAGARQMLHDHLLREPNDPDALEKLAEIFVSEGASDEATILLQRAVAADPAPRRRLLLVDQLRRHGAPALALGELEQLPDAVRARFEVMAMEAALAALLGMHERELALYREMIRQQPANPGTWVALGNALNSLGRAAEAVKAAQRALRTEPGFGEAWWALANFKSFRFAPRDIAQMRKMLDAGLPPRDALHVHFALGKAHEDRGEFRESFDHYAAGNAIRASGVDPAQAGVGPLVDESIATFTAGFFARNRASGCAGEGPIFVVGLHRSGSTLVEQILASHPLVEGTTELNLMKTIRDRIVRSSGTTPAAAIASLTPSELRRLGEEYLDRTRAFRQTDRPFFVDKLPGNWLNLPLIRAALPNARIVDARRHPMACGFSNFKQNYASGVGFSYSLATIGAFYQDYWRFMRHFDAVQPGVVCRLINERLVDNPEGEVRRMLDHLGLPFDPACLEFHKNARAVRTPSAEQVRKPINRDGLEQWRNYEPWLGELEAALGPALDHWED